MSEREASPAKAAGELIARRKVTKYPRFDAAARIEEIMADGRWRSMRQIKKAARVVTVVGLKTTTQDVSAADVGNWFKTRLLSDRAGLRCVGKYQYYRLLLGSKDDFEGQDEATGGKGDLDAKQAENSKSFVCNID